jgi:transketolase
MEGVNHEAIGLAGHLKLGRLIVLWDDNKITIDGSTDLSRSEDVVARHQAAGWQTLECDGLDAGKVSKAIDHAASDERPTLIRCRTIIGYGAPNLQGTAATHGAALGKEEVEAARKELGLQPEEFAIPDDVLKGWRAAGARGSTQRSEWYRRLDASGKKEEFLGRLEGNPDENWLKPHIDKLLADPKPVASRKASEMALEAINAVVPTTIGGSADLTGSNNTKTKALEPLVEVVGKLDSRLAKLEKQPSGSRVLKGVTAGTQVFENADSKFPDFTKYLTARSGLSAGQKLTKATITSSGWSYGLSYVEAGNFIDYVVDQSVLLKLVRMIKMAAKKQPVDKIGLGGTVLKKGTPGTDPGDTVSPRREKPAA